MHLGGKKQETIHMGKWEEKGTERREKRKRDKRKEQFFLEV
jgi:hypothetical protein